MKKTYKTLFLSLVFVTILIFTGCNQSLFDKDVDTKKVDNTKIEQPTNDKNNKYTIELIKYEKAKKIQDRLLVVKSNSLALKSKPNNNGYIVGKIYKDDLLPIFDKVGNYYKSRFNNQDVYIYIDNNIGIKEIPKANIAIENMLNQIKDVLGVKYVFGAERYHWGNGILNPKFTLNAFDCSSLVQYAFYTSNGIMLDTTSRAQSLQGKSITTSNLKRGDVMFFTNTTRKYDTGIDKIGHVGIYFGDNYIIHTASDYAIIEPISATRWNNLISIKRYL